MKLIVLCVDRGLLLSNIGLTLTLKIIYSGYILIRTTLNVLPFTPSFRYICTILKDVYSLLRLIYHAAL